MRAPKRLGAGEADSGMARAQAFLGSLRLLVPRNGRHLDPCRQLLGWLLTSARFAKRRGAQAHPLRRHSTCLGLHRGLVSPLSTRDETYTPRLQASVLLILAQLSR